MKQFVKALKMGGDCFKYICLKFPGLIREILKSETFDKSQIQMFINDSNFGNIMNPAELNA